MNKTKYLILTLALLLFVGSNADARKKRKTKKKAEAVLVDTCSVDTFSYAYGMANTTGLEQYLTSKMGVDMAYLADFLKGFDVTAINEEVKKAAAFYAGYQIRQQITNQVIPQIDREISGNDTTETVNKALFMEGFRNAIAGENQKMDMKRADSLTLKQMTFYHNALMERKYGANRKAGEEFLKANAKNKGVEETKSGLQYKILVKGNGEKPEKTSKVKVHYEGKLIDGTVFDSSYKRNEPAVFPCDQVIKGWTEALTLMPVGSKWEIYIPQELGYGSREAGKIPPFSTLIFTVELLEIVK